jgi:hypothetical protein
MWLHPRLEIRAPQLSAGDVPWWKVWHGHGSDEYGNCSWSLITVLLGGVVVFSRRHFQRDVLVPDADQFPDPSLRAEAWQRWHDRRYNREA